MNRRANQSGFLGNSRLQKSIPDCERTSVVSLPFEVVEFVLFGFSEAGNPTAEIRAQSRMDIDLMEVQPEYERLERLHRYRAIE